MSSQPFGSVVIDAGVAIAISSREAGREQLVNAEMLRYATLGYNCYAPGAIVAETRYVLCGKLQQGRLTAAEHSHAVVDFHTLLSRVLPPPSGEAALVARADAIRTGYGCSRSADGIYIALAEELAKSCPSVILTFDQDMPNQATKNAPGVTVHVL